MKNQTVIGDVSLIFRQDSVTTGHVVVATNLICPKAHYEHLYFVTA